MTQPLGIAVIGHSFMGRAHSHAWSVVHRFADVPAVRKQVLVGRNETRVAQAAAELGWEEYSTDLDAVLARDDIHVVDICTPGHLHAAAAIKALNAGKHVLVEKPLANSIEEAQAMVDAAAAAAQNGTKAMVGFNYRSVPALIEAQKLIAAGRLGEIRQIKAQYLQDWLVSPDAPMTWRLRAETAGSGALGDLASHAIDQIAFLTGDPVVQVSGTVTTFVTERRGEDGPEPVTVDDAAWAVLHLASGAVASVEVSRTATGHKNGLEIGVYGSTGALRFNLENLNELHFTDLTLPVAEQGFRRILVTEPEHASIANWWPAGHIIGWDSSFVNQMGRFLGNIHHDTQPSPSLAEGLATQRVLDAWVTSAANGSERTQVGA